MKTVECIRMTTRAERLQALKDARYNPLRLEADTISVDLLTDSGVGAMSNMQWAGLMAGDESYTGSRSFKRLESTIKRLTGFDYVVPAHQGRGAEHVLFSAVLEHKENSTVLSNGVFETSENVISGLKCEVVDITVPKGEENGFGGNVDCKKLEELIACEPYKVSSVLLVITNNVISGQPVSMRNIEEASKLCRKYNIPLVGDACRFAENAWYIKISEDGFAEMSVFNICLKMLGYFDAIYISAKKNGLCNIGGFVCVKSEEMYMTVRRKCIIYEGHFTYGGISGRDMEAIAVGLEECLDENYLHYRFETLKQFAKFLRDAGAPVVAVASSAVFIDACKALSHVSIDRQPSWSLACALYIEGGIRTFGDITSPGQIEDSLKLAVPHRVYTISHLKYVAKIFERVLRKASRIQGLRVIKEPDFPQKCYEVELEPIGHTGDGVLV